MTNVKTLDSGRIIYRHPNGQGSVIEFDMFGRKTKLFVADAEFRCISTLGQHRDYGFTKFNEDPRFIMNYDNHNQRLSYSVTDEELQALFPSFAPCKTETAKFNTDKLMKFDDTEAAHHCRNINLEGVGELDLPNVYELMVLYLESDAIDDLDPTVTTHSYRALGYKNPRGRFCTTGPCAYFSSSEMDEDNVRPVGCHGNVNCTGPKDYLGGVCPVAELSGNPRVCGTERTIYRHPNGQGSVIEFDMFGRKTKLFVADAKFRTTARWGNYVKAIEDLIITAPSKEVFIQRRATDKEVQDLYRTLIGGEPVPSRTSTNKIVEFKYTDAAQYCRSVALEGVGCLDLPNLYELMIIFSEADNIDALDPTVEYYPQYALGSANENGHFTFGRVTETTNITKGLWSCDSSEKYACSVKPYGVITLTEKFDICGVCPVRNLSSHVIPYKRVAQVMDITRRNNLASGRTIYRHENGQGSVIEFDMFGRKTKLFVADAEFRCGYAWGCNDVNTKMREYKEILRYTYFAPLEYDDAHKTEKDHISDSSLQKTFKMLDCEDSARSNTDKLVQFEDALAAQYCRSLDIDGIDDLDLPNLYELMVMYIEADNIDALDPTVEYYPQHALGRKNPNGRFGGDPKNAMFGILSSCLYEYNMALTISPSGRLIEIRSFWSAEVCPVCEIEN